MYLTRFITDGRTCVGLIVGDSVIDLSSQFNSMSEAITAFSSNRTLDTSGLPSFPYDQVTLAPVVDPDALVVGVALNYAAHVDETKNKNPPTPVIFFKPYTCLVGAGSTIVKPRVTEKFDYEGEIGIVMGKEVYDPTEKEAADAIWGITAINDVSGRDLLRINTDENTVFHDWVSCKALEKSSPIGPCIVPLEDVREGYKQGTMAVETILNGNRVQRGQVDQLLVDFVGLVQHVASRFRLRPGDVIATGTPGGVGAATGRLLQDGDEISIRVTGVPALDNSISFS